MERYDRILWQGLHENWVVSIKHCPYLSEFGFISGCRSSKKSLYYGDLTGPSTGSTFDIKRGVSCIEYCEATQSIYVGCVDGKVYSNAYLSI